MICTRTRIPGAGLLVAAFTLALAGCAGQPATREEKLAYGKELLEEMSDTLAAARTISLSTTERVERADRDGSRHMERITREVHLRRPDRLWFRVTGDRNLEGFYDGERFTLVAHQEKVFGRIPAPPTVDATVRELRERYGIVLPVSGLLAASPQQSLLDEATIGGWAGPEVVDGGLCNLLAWDHPDVDWSIWIPVKGKPLPKKLLIMDSAQDSQPKTTVSFERWNLASPMSDAAFTWQAPSGYAEVDLAWHVAALRSFRTKVQL
jgi:hypothetical protein